MTDAAPYLITTRYRHIDADTSTVRLPDGPRVECSAPLDACDIPSGYARPGAPRGTCYVIAWIGGEDPMCSSLRAEPASAALLDYLGFDGAAAGGYLAVAS